MRAFLAAPTQGSPRYRENLESAIIGGIEPPVSDTPRISPSESARRSPWPAAFRTHAGMIASLDTPRLAALLFALGCLFLGGRLERLFLGLFLGVLGFGHKRDFDLLLFRRGGLGLRRLLGGDRGLLLLVHAIRFGLLLRGLFLIRFRRTVAHGRNFLELVRPGSVIAPTRAALSAGRPPVASTISSEGSPRPMRRSELSAAGAARKQGNDAEC